MSRRLRIGLVTCEPDKMRFYFPTSAEPDLVPTELPFTPDDQLLVDELRRRGHEVRPVIWGGDPATLDAQFDRLIVRSPWDFMDSDASRLRFMEWVQALDAGGIAVDNSAPALAWLSDKRYLADFAELGVPIVPTRFVLGNCAVVLTECFPNLPLVVKPGISGAGAGLVVLQTRAEQEAFQPEFARRCATQRHLVQPLLPEIRTAGEWSLVYFDGVYSHAVHKAPAAHTILCQAEQGGSIRFTDPPAQVREAGERVNRLMPLAFAQHSPARVSFPLLYTRIDLIETAQGPLLSECEGVEPELFFRARPGSERLFADRFEQRLK
jgi:glutathione synthase/RimK-type ligase-like ATP-grasp enzyme